MRTWKPFVIFLVGILLTQGWSGCDFAADEPDMPHRWNRLKASAKADGFFNIWNGEHDIDYSSPLDLDRTSFSGISAGKILRLSFSSLKAGSIGGILAGWEPIPDCKDANLVRYCSTYFEYMLTDEVLGLLKEKGLRVTGRGYTLSSVDIVDPQCLTVIPAQCDSADIRVWEREARPSLKITITNPTPENITVPLSVFVSSDDFSQSSRIEQSVSLIPNETVTTVTDLDLSPGFYRLAVDVNRNNTFIFNIGYALEDVTCQPNPQPDFWSFWDSWVDRLEAIDMDAEMTLLDSLSNGYRNIYEVRLLSAPDTNDGAPVEIWGYYAEPKKAVGTFPTLIHYYATDNGTTQPTIPLSDNFREWCEFYLSVRGQMLSRIKEQERTGQSQTAYSDPDGFYALGYGDRDNHYYRAAYLDCLRAVDFVLTRSKVDQKRIFAEGGSQGGCFSYVAAALSRGRIKGIAPSLTGHSDFPHTMQMLSWPTNVFRAKKQELGWSDKQIEVFNSYFDTMNFVSRITCPVITNISLQDRTDCPHIGFMPFQLLDNVDGMDKECIFNPWMGHQSCKGWIEIYCSFLLLHTSASSYMHRKFTFLHDHFQQKVLNCII